ncbi:MAG: membrane protein insertase YidC [Deltaproteobacteria bacterium]|nr:membrane protein insertase YidC [Deltaproteobacteria bacterium]
MDKRTIAALVLSLLVLILWSVFFAPQSEQRSEPQVIEEAPRKAPPSPAPGPSAAGILKRAPEPVVSQREEKEITIDTPLYKAVFSNAGPALKSFKLKKYRLSTEEDSSLVELAPENTDFIKIFFQPVLQEAAAPIIFEAGESALSLDHGSSPRELVFTAVTPMGLSVRQSLLFDPDSYIIGITIDYDNHSERSVEGNIKARIANLPPKEKASYYSFTGLSFLKEGKVEEIAPGKLEKGEKTFSGPLQWFSYQEDYFMAAAIPENTPYAHFAGKLLPSGIVEGIWTGPSESVDSGGRLSSHFTLFLGPRDLSLLKEAGKNLEKAINFGWTDIIAKPLLYTLRFFNGYVHNYGIAIILLTIVIKILFWPLTHKSYKSMKEMQKLQPLMAKLREKYKGNKEQMNKELMGLYKTYKVNPMGGCLPMVIQIPVFFALFRVLGVSIELRHAPFFLWINDLSAPDRLFRFPFEIPFMSPPYGIPVLTLLMGASMFFQQKMTPTPGDPTQAKIMLFLPIIFTVMFINFPSGLVLYWLVNNVLSIGQQYRIIKGSA